MAKRLHEASYVLGKLRLSVGDLATSSGGMVERLRALYVPHLMVLSSDDFPGPLREDWKWIHDRLTADGPIRRNDEVVRGAVDNTLDGCLRRARPKSRGSSSA